MARGRVTAHHDFLLEDGPSKEARRRWREEEQAIAIYEDRASYGIGGADYERSVCDPEPSDLRRDWEYEMAERDTQAYVEWMER